MGEKENVPDGRRIVASGQAFASIWFCDPNHWGLAGCGLFMFYKPEKNSAPLECPGCDRATPWNQVEGELVRMEVLKVVPLHEVQ